MKHKRYLTIILAAASGLLFLGACTSSSTPPPPKTMTLKVGPQATSTIAQLRPGDTLKIVLPGNPPQGGYAWVNAGRADSVLEQQGPAVFTPAGKPGAMDTVTFTFLARRAGAQMLNLAYRRLNDKTTPLEKTYGVSVVVQG